MKVRLKKINTGINPLKTKPRKEFSKTGTVSTPMFEFVYALCEPTTFKPRYVGKTKDIKGRYFNYFTFDSSSQLQKKRQERTKWLKGLLAKNEQPIMCILERVNIGEGIEREEYYTEKFINEGHELFNERKGYKPLDRLRTESKAFNKGHSKLREPQIKKLTSLHKENIIYGE